MNNRRSIYTPLVISLVLILGILTGNWYGRNFSQGSSFMNPGTSLSLSPRVNKLNSVINYIENEYVDTVNLNDITDAAIPAILEELDPHSVYIPARDLKKYTEPLVGNFSGIGVQFNMSDDTVAIVNTIPNGPSEIVGILAGDRIILVNGKKVSGIKMVSDSVVGRLKGPKGTRVKVSVLRRGVSGLLDFDITRDDIPLYSVDVAYMIDNNTGFIKISTFSQTTYKEFVKAVEELHAKGMTSLILDLRSNGGGIMDAATNIADEFLDGKQLIVYTQGRSKPRHDFYSTPGGLCIKDDVTILIDEFSASASEILAGAIQDNDRGKVIGRRSFGKGLVQEQIQFRDGSAMRLTIARYYTPTGRSIQKPYSKDRNNYYMDLNLRMQHGEFESADSIHFNDSLKYFTKGGNIVYGGGGIMPDVFIPLDTSGTSEYFEKVRNLGIMYRFSFDYWDANRSSLAKLVTAKEISSYLDGSNYFEDFLKYAASKGVQRNNDDLKISGRILRTQLKAYIARNIIDNSGFYPIIEEIDTTLKEAIRLINQ
jgi:carboxyl-terminal processing protease